MKSNIVCEADHCLHNRNGLCDASVVHVREGKEHAQGTRCTTYAYRISNNGSRLLMEMGEDMSLDRRDKNEDIPIACGKFDCRHNEDCVCGAKAIHVLAPHDGGQCPCATYKPR